MTFLTDRQIRQRKPLEPFSEKEQFEFGDTTYLSGGLSSFGYDIRISEEAPPLLFHPSLVDRLRRFIGAETPHHGDRRYYREMKTHVDTKMSKPSLYVVIPPHGFALAKSHEYFNMPVDLVGLCVGKSSWMRRGLLIDSALIEPGWSGRLAMGLFNMNRYPVRVYLGTPITQVCFLPVGLSETVYKGGKYDKQDDNIIAR